MPNAQIPDHMLSLLDSKPSVIVFMSNASFDGIPQRLIDKPHVHVRRPLAFRSILTRISSFEF